MVGQGSPDPGPARLVPAGVGTGRTLFRLCLFAHWVLVAPVLFAAEPTMLLRVGWGGGAERQWHGSISIDKGSIALARSLGIVADSPGSIWPSSETQIEIRERSARAYDGLDLEVTAPPDAKLTISLNPDAENRPTVIEAPLSELANKPRRHPLDDRDNQLLVRRSPGDLLRVETARDPLIFTPGETWNVEMKPRLLPVAVGTTVNCKCRLLAARTTTEVWSKEQSFKTVAADAEPPSFKLEVKIPDAEGVYDLAIEASERGPLRWIKPIAERRVQIVVLADRSAPIPGDASHWSQVLEIDPANPRWFDRWKALPRLSVMIPSSLGKEISPVWQGPLDNGAAQITQHALGRVVQLGSTGKPGDLGWAAYPLSVAKPGLPHVLEIDYPSDAAQTLGISIIEPNSAGAVAPIELDSGFYNQPAGPQASPRWAQHQLIFWPRTQSPVVLLTNRREGQRATYGKLRLYSGPTRLARTFPLSDEPPERLMAAYLARPLFPANFSASESLDAFTGRSLTDWQTFYEGATRLTDYVNHIGYNGLMLGVLAEGSTIYPSKVLEPTPRFDTGAFFDQGLDPVRKDVLELVFRLFDREKLKLIPAVQFAAPLPELEAMIRDSGPGAVGLQWVGRDGGAWTDTNEPRHGLAPYYNVLDSRVQEAMLHVIREIVDRYSQHESFAGLGIELSAEGFSQLPGDAWGLDDRTIEQFGQQMQVRVPGSGQERFAERARFVGDGGPGHRQWLQWRCGVLADFHRRIRKELATARPEARLYLAPVDLLGSPELQRDLRPGLPSRGRIDDALQAAGINPENYRGPSGIVLLRQHRLLPPGPLGAQAVDLEINRSSDWDAAIRDQANPGSLFYHEPQRARLASFDAKSPFGKDKTYTWLVSEFSPAQQDNRRRFVHSLATLDSSEMFDGGWLLPLGQEPALADLMAVYRRLPAARFETIADCPLPCTARTLRTERRTYVYVTNDSPWHVRVALPVRADTSARPEELGAQHRAEFRSEMWTVDLEPYDIAAARFATGEVHFGAPQVTIPGEAKAALEASVRELRERRIALESPQPLQLLNNPGFELPARSGVIPGWTWTSPTGGQAILEMKNAHGGRQSLRLKSNGPSVTLRSELFATPQTGRLAVSLWLKLADANDQPRVRLVLEGSPDGRTLFRTAILGEGAGVVPIPSQWKQFVFAIDDLPPEAPTQLRFRVDLAGAGDVSLDDVQMFDLVFTDAEKIQLSKIVALADFQITSGRHGECLNELDGFWPRLLLSQSPRLTGPIVSIPPIQASPQHDVPEKSAAKPNVVDRIKDLWKL